MAELWWVLLPVLVGVALVAAFLAVRLRTPPQREGPTASGPDYKSDPTDTGA